MLPRELQRSLRQEPEGLTAKALALFAGAAILLLTSIAIVVFGRGSAPGPVASAPPPTATVVAALDATPTAAPETPTPPPTQPPSPFTPTRPAPTPTTTPTPRPATATATAGATPQLPLVVQGGCAASLPPGFGEETPQGGYYPALDQSGFAALDSFDTANGQRTPEEIAQVFATTVLSKVIQNYQQTGAERAGDGYRVDYTATVGSKTGRGSFYIKQFGPVACGATLYTLDGSSLPFATSYNLMVVSLKPAPSPRPGTATPVR